jgi:hypothetical protein
MLLAPILIGVAPEIGVHATLPFHAANSDAHVPALLRRGEAECSVEKVRPNVARKERSIVAVPPHLTSTSRCSITP